MEYKPLPVPEDLMETTFSAPTVAINRFIVSGSPESMRISFGESRTTESPIHFRISVAMTPFQAWELAKIINNFLGPRIVEFEAQVNAIPDTK